MTAIPLIMMPEEWGFDIPEDIGDKTNVKRWWPNGPSTVELPEWVLRVHVRWNGRYSNPPKTEFSVPRGWREEIFNGGKPWSHDKIRQIWWRTSKCGMVAQMLWHGPAVTTVPISGNRTVWATAQSEGFGGRTFLLETEDRTVAVRGPWHGCPPLGWTDVVYDGCADLVFRNDLVAAMHHSVGLGSALVDRGLRLVYQEPLWNGHPKWHQNTWVPEKYRVTDDPADQAVMYAAVPSGT